MIITWSSQLPRGALLFIVSRAPSPASHVIACPNGYYLRRNDSPAMVGVDDRKWLIIISAQLKYLRRKQSESPIMHCTPGSPVWYIFITFRAKLIAINTDSKIQGSRTRRMQSRQFFLISLYPFD